MKCPFLGCHYCKPYTSFTVLRKAIKVNLPQALPVQAALLHGRSSAQGPRQSDPPKAGPWQSRVLCRVPFPQVTEQRLQLVHLDQWPSTGWGRETECGSSEKTQQNTSNIVLIFNRKKIRRNASLYGTHHRNKHIHKQCHHQHITIG